MSDRVLRDRVRFDYARYDDSGEKVPLPEQSVQAVSTSLPTVSPSLPVVSTPLPTLDASGPGASASLSAVSASLSAVSASLSVVSASLPAVSAFLPVVSVSSVPVIQVEMSSIPKVTGELSGLVFQIGEILEDLVNVNSLSLDVLQRNLDELKALRVCVVKVSSELRLLKDEQYEVKGATAAPTGGIEAEVNELLQNSKAMISTLKNAIEAKQQNVHQQNIAVQQQKNQQEAAQIRERKFAFDKIITEIIGLSGGCEQFYRLDDRNANLTAEKLLKRKEMKSSFASDLARLRVLVDRVLNYTDVQFQGKAELLDSHLENINRLEGMKLEFEMKLHVDLENYDLTDQKLKLATQTKVDIGKFSGSLEKGMDFYMFKTKFLRAYRNHPKSLLVEFLVNNHLEGKARDCVGSLENLEEIWERLKTNFGDTQELLIHQFKKIKELGPMQRQKNFEMKKHYLQKLVNIMQDIHDLAVEHNLTNQLYYGSHIQKVVNILENRTQTKFCELIAAENVQKPQEWMRLHRLLTTELQVVQIRVSQMFESDDSGNKKSNDDQKKDSAAGAGGGTNSNRVAQNRGGQVMLTVDMCRLCDEKHSRCNEAFTLCKKFLLATVKERHDLVMKKKRCLQCLNPTVRWDKSHDCSDLWVCPHSSHDSFSKKLHFLLCVQHAEDVANKEKYQEFKVTVLTADWQKKLHSSIFITIHSFTAATTNKPVPEENAGPKIEELDENEKIDCLVSVKNPIVSGPDPVEETGGSSAHDIVSTEMAENSVLNADADNNSAACYMLQPYPLDGHVYSMMFDTGCGKFVARDAAIDTLPSKYKKNTRPGPIFISGVGCQVAESKYGEYTVSLPMYDNTLVDFTGISLNMITGAMPPYPLKEVSKDIVADYVREGGQATELPDIPVLAGGETDFLIGILYNYYLPRLVHILPTGLAIYKSMFAGIDGARGCVGGPHKLFLQCERQFLESNNNSVAQFRVFLQQQIQLFNTGIRVCLDVGMLNSTGFQVASCCATTTVVNADAENKVMELVSSKLEVFEDADASTIQETNCLEVVAADETIVSENPTSDHAADLEDNCTMVPAAVSITKTKNNSIIVADDVNSNVVAEDLLVPGNNKNMLDDVLVNAAADGTGVPNKQIGKVILAEAVDSIDLIKPLSPSVAVVNMDDPDQQPIVLLSKKFNALEDTCTIEYRCIRCRGCPYCKKGEHIEKISFREEREQELVADSVEVDTERKITSATLPFIADPEEKLAPNRDVAYKVYRQQLRKLARDDKKREGVIRSEQKLQDAGHVNWVTELSEEEKKLLEKGLSIYIPWRFVENPNSLSTPIRLVFDASSTTSTGLSLNDILAKGINSLNSMICITIRFRSYKIALHTDIKQMYNVIKLKPEHWKFQRYLWDPELNIENDPQEKIIDTIIYGVKSSGNQAECGLRKTAEVQKNIFPKAAESILNDTYMDDIATGCDNDDITQLASDLTELLSLGGFETKGLTVAGKPPPPTLTKDGVSINVLGTKWYSELDYLGLAFGKLNFSKKVRGSKSHDADAWVVPDKLTRSMCAGKVGEIFDVCGFAAPIVAGFKIDLRELVDSSYDWQIPVLKPTHHYEWLKNFDLMTELSSCTWPRALIPIDCESNEVEFIGCGDASQNVVCAVCYIRVLRADGTYSCQIILSKTKMVPKGMTLPRAELLAAILNVHIVEIVKRALARFAVKRCVYVLDSEIALHWLASETKRLKPWVRNNVIEASRFSETEQWFKIDSDKNPADLGTRKGASVKDVDGESEWCLGKDWMYQPWDALIGTTLKDVNDIKLKNEQLNEMKKELAKPATDLCASEFDAVIQDCSSVAFSGGIDLCFATTSLPEEMSAVNKRYDFSHYLLDPNKFTFERVVRQMAVVIKFCRLMASKIGRDLSLFPLLAGGDDDELTGKKFANEITIPGLELSDSDIQCSLNYFFRKATAELKSFVNSKQYERDSIEKAGIIYYSGRVLNSDISYECNMTEKMLDLSRDTFIVPIVDRHSPLAYAIVNQFHWEDKTVKHCGVETTIRAVMSLAHILRVRELVKSVRKNCKRCRYILKRTVEVIMGPTSKDQLCVAPPFFITQVDIDGPYKAYSVHNKRATIKVYISTFVCCTTGMTCLKLMESYDTVQFLLAFSRFACELGFPKKLLVDEGSQLVSGCKNAVLNMTDIKGTLSCENGIEFRTCPVGGHNYNGRAERKIRSVQEVMNKTVHQAKMSIIEWETFCAEVSNSINNLPMAIGNEVDELENLDLLTPNRLRLGRNNQRSPVGPLEVTDKLERMMQLKLDVFQSWWESWLVSAVPKLMPRPKWFVNERDVMKGDIILFHKDDGKLVGEYKYGIIESVTASKDGRIRAATIRYRNAHENFDRTTKRAVRTLVLIHRVDEIDLMEELGNAVTYANGCYCIGLSARAPGV